MADRQLKKAVHHILRRMQNDGRVAWLLGPGSEAYDQLTAAFAAADTLSCAAFAIRCLKDGVDIGEKLPDTLARIDGMLARGVAPPLPHWEPCNEGCDPEWGGCRSRSCTCEAAKAALGVDASDEAQPGDLDPRAALAYAKRMKDYCEAFNGRGLDQRDAARLARRAEPCARAGQPDGVRCHVDEHGRPCRCWREGGGLWLR